MKDFMSELIVKIKSTKILKTLFSRSTIELYRDILLLAPAHGFEPQSSPRNWMKDSLAR